MRDELIDGDRVYHVHLPFEDGTIQYLYPWPENSSRYLVVWDRDIGTDRAQVVERRLLVRLIQDSEIPL